MTEVRELRIGKDGKGDIAELFAALHDGPQGANAAFLDSSLRNSLGRHSVIGVSPYLCVEAVDDVCLVDGREAAEGFLPWLRRYLREHHEENRTGLPMAAGAIGYFSYDYGRRLQGVPSVHDSKNAPESATGPDIPACRLLFYDNLVVADHRTGKVFATASGQLDDTGRSLDRLEELAGTVTQRDPHAVREQAVPQVSSDFCEEDYHKALRRMVRYIVDGDIYIANMTRQICVKTAKPPFAVFQHLRAHNPAPFGAYLNYDDAQVVCASPERFLRLSGATVRTSPIKGTRPRGHTPTEDERLKLELLESEKDKSELLMIVDLERNDLNRVCAPGSVKVTDLFALEAYATVFHLISTVEGTLRADSDVTDLLEATLPGGSISGAPKIRALEIIDELERSPRGLYTGSLGYIGLDGCCDLNIVIRTALHQAGRYHIGVGGGITYESVEHLEYLETDQKARALLEALR
ncbi:MAG: aminodeoxychorismate synthase component I [Coriobacteriales bacterium]|jgi:para-aminobenzoate synthetase component 1|nr:aminodeoxychorismate synthase component I [Coriobacteriales bacterium]